METTTTTRWKYSCLDCHFLTEVTDTDTDFMGRCYGCKSRNIALVNKKELKKYRVYLHLEVPQYEVEAYSIDEALKKGYECLRYDNLKYLQVMDEEIEEVK